MAKAPRSLSGKVVAITGGARGIGRATAAALISQGARVAIGDIDEAVVAQTAQQLGGGTIALRIDVTSRASFEAFLNEVEARLGPLEILINNAGIMPVGPFIEETDATAKRMVDINLHGVIFGSKLALARFGSRRSGHLVNLASIAGKHATPRGATYAATKFGVVGLSESLKEEYRGTGIDVSVVLPVGVNTELYSGVKQLRGIKTPEPEDVANAIVEALQTGRFAVYVPKLMGPVTYLNGLLPRSAASAVARLLGSQRAFSAPDDSGARAAYNARIAQEVARAEEPEPASSAAGDE